MTKEIQIGKIYKLRDIYTDVTRYTQIPYLHYIVPLLLSQDGQVITFVSLRDGNEHVFLIDNIKRYEIYDFGDIGYTACNANPA